MTDLGGTPVATGPHFSITAPTTTTAGATFSITVTDDGNGDQGDTVTGPERVGLGNTRARLEALYGPAASLELSHAEGRGARVTVRIPRRSEGP